MMPGLASALLALALLAGTASAVPVPEAGRLPGPGITFDERSPTRLVLRAPGYQLTLRKHDGAIVDLVDRRAGTRLLRGSDGCIWGAFQAGSTDYVGGCTFSPGSAQRFSYAWDRATMTLTLSYRDEDERGVGAVVSLRAGDSSFDLRGTIENHAPAVVKNVLLPAALVGDVDEVEAGYAPNYLPGVRLRPSFFRRVGTGIVTYPSRLGFADYLALDMHDGGHLALHSVAPDRPYPVDLGFLHTEPPGACWGPAYCVVHAFQTWIRRGESWTSPVVRITVGVPVEETIAAYRRDTGIDAYPSAAEKLGARLPTLARAPLVKADLPKLQPFGAWGPDLRRLPVPSLLHPVSFQPGGHDGSDPDFLPPDPRWGSTADLRAMVVEAHALGHLVMPYLNVSWWDERSPTLQGLTPEAARSVAAHDADGDPIVEKYNHHTGPVTSPYSPLVRARVARLRDEWRDEVPVDCLFFDQLGARNSLYDFNPAAPHPLAYNDGWLELIQPFRDRCLMVEDGWDRLARDASAFHGSALMMAREHDDPDVRYGEGNWEPYPLATWLLHDKVLLYQHDLFEGTMTTDLEVLSWNMAFGLILSYSWDGWTNSIANPWLELAGSYQRAVGPHYAGVPLGRYRTLGAGLTESTFGGLVVTTNWDRARAARVDDHGLPPYGFVAATKDGRLLAGAFADTFAGSPLSEGTHYLIVERAETEVTVRQPLGADTALEVDPPLSWKAGQPVRAMALGRGGEVLGETRGEVRDGRFAFHYAATLNGRPVAAYRIAVG